MTKLNTPRSHEGKSKGKASKQIIRIETTLLGGYKAITSRGLVCCIDKAELLRYLKTL